MNGLDISTLRQFAAVGDNGFDASQFKFTADQNQVAGFGLIVKDGNVPDDSNVFVRMSVLKTIRENLSIREPGKGPQEFVSGKAEEFFKEAESILLGEKTQGRYSAEFAKQDLSLETVRSLLVKFDEVARTTTEKSAHVDLLIASAQLLANRQVTEDAFPKQLQIVAPDLKLEVIEDLMQKQTDASEALAKLHGLRMGRDTLVFSPAQNAMLEASKAHRELAAALSAAANASGLSAEDRNILLGLSTTARLVSNELNHLMDTKGNEWTKDCTALLAEVLNTAKSVDGKLVMRGETDIYRSVSSNLEKTLARLNGLKDGDREALAEIRQTLAHERGRLQNHLQLDRITDRGVGQSLVQILSYLESAMDGGEALKALLDGKVGVDSLVYAYASGCSVDDIEPSLVGDRITSKSLGNGAVNNVYDVKVGDKSHVFKPSQNANLGLHDLKLVKTAFMRSSAGCQAAQLNMASYDTAKMLGVEDIVVKTTVGCLNGKTGLFMEKAPGTSLMNIISKAETRGDTQFGELKFKDICDLPKETNQKVISELARQTNRLQWLDLITGQLDRTNDNYHIAIKTNGDVVVKGIDNDLSFPADITGIGKFRLDEKSAPYKLKDYNLDPTSEAVKDLGNGVYEVDVAKMKFNQFGAFFNLTGTFGLCAPDHMDRTVYANVKEMLKDDCAAFRKMLAGRKLSPAQIESAVNRLRDAGKIGDLLAQQGRIYGEDDWNKVDTLAQIFKNSPEDRIAADPTFVSMKRLNGGKGNKEFAIYLFKSKLRLSNYIRRGNDYFGLMLNPDVKKAIETKMGHAIIISDQLRQEAMWSNSKPEVKDPVEKPVEKPVEAPVKESVVEQPNDEEPTKFEPPKFDTLVALNKPLYDGLDEHEQQALKDFETRLVGSAPDVRKTFSVQTMAEFCKALRGLPEALKFDDLEITGIGTSYTSGGANCAAFEPSKLGDVSELDDVRSRYLMTLRLSKEPQDILDTRLAVFRDLDKYRDRVDAEVFEELRKSVFSTRTSNVPELAKTIAAKVACLELLSAKSLAHLLHSNNPKVAVALGCDSEEGLSERIGDMLNAERERVYADRHEIGDSRDREEVSLANALRHLILTSETQQMVRSLMYNIRHGLRLAFDNVLDQVAHPKIDPKTKKPIRPYFWDGIKTDYVCRLQLELFNLETYISYGKMARGLPGQERLAKRLAADANQEAKAIVKHQLEEIDGKMQDAIWNTFQSLLWPKEA